MRTLRNIIFDLCEFHQEPHHRWDGSVWCLEKLIEAKETESKTQKLISEYLWINHTKRRFPASQGVKFEELKRELFNKQMQLENLYGL